MKDNGLEKLGDKEKHIFIVVDGAVDSKKTIAYVIDFFGTDSYKATIFSILPIPAKDMFATEDEFIQCLSRAKESTLAVLESCKEFLISAGLPEEKVRTKLEIRDCKQISECINKARQSEEACIVVVGRRSKKRQNEAIFGCVATRLLKKITNALHDESEITSDCPIFIVKLDGTLEHVDKCDNVYL